MSRHEIVEGAHDAILNGSKSFRASSQLFDRTTRERTWLLYCWCRHCDDQADGQRFGFASDRETGSVADLIDKSRRAFAGEKVGELPFDALRQLVRERPIPPHLIEDHLEGFVLDEQGWRPQTEEDLWRYSYHVAGAVGCMMAVIMGVDPDDSETLERAADLGIAFQLSNIARDIREDHAAGRCYLPQEWLDEYGVAREDVMKIENRTAVAAMAGRLADSARHYQQSARKGVGKLPFRSRLAVLAAGRIYGAIGEQVRDLGIRAWDRRVTVGKVRKLAFLVPSLVEAITYRGRSS